jgi:hypothetical protein
MRLEEQTAQLSLYRNGAHAWLPEPANKQGHTHRGHAGGGARPRAELVIWAQGSRSMWRNRWGSVASAGRGSAQAVFRSLKISKILQDFPSHRIFGRMHAVLNVGKKN